jgi:hypothetical protein
MNNLGVVLFHTTSAALRSEKLLKAAGLTVKLIPTPRELSSECGLALRFAWDKIEDVRGVLESARVDIAAIHALTSY